MAGAIIMCVCNILCAIIFIAVGVAAHKSEKPIHFWAGSTVPPEEIRDIPAYNRANGMMWLTYGGLFVLIALGSSISAGGAGIADAVACVVGLPALIWIYRRIYNKYKA